VPGRPPRYAIFISSMGGGGAQRVVVNIVQGMAARGAAVDLLLARPRGPLLTEIPPGVRIVRVGRGHVSAALPAVVRYLRRERPAAMLTALDYVNVVALAARRLAGVPTRMVVTEHNTLSVAIRNAVRRRRRLLPPLMRRTYPWADEIVAVSRGVADDLAETLHLDRERVRVIYNPIVNAGARERARAPLEDPWFGPGLPPVILAVGGFRPQKDYATMIRAFALVRRQVAARLLVLGDGKGRPAVEALVAEAGLGADVRLPGFVDNPLAWMRRAAVYVLSSQWEGLPTVLIEALYCGIPIVSTDCPSGPREILDGGRYGRLVPAGSPESLAEGLLAALRGEVPRPEPSSWAPYTEEAVVDAYTRLLTGAA